VAIQSGEVADMEMDDMFLADDEGALSQEDTDSSDEDFIPAASVRYKPTDEAVTDEDMDIMQSAGEVEMVDDIGSLAQFGCIAFGLDHNFNRK
jgi:hypothetical protein